MVLLSLAVILIGVISVTASEAQVTRGAISTYAAGPGRGLISPASRMVRTADGRTVVKVEAWGLKPDATYPVHVHNAPCTVNNGGGHYQDVVGGPVDKFNEIWPGFTTDASGHGNGRAANDFTARPEAQAIVIHDSDGSGARMPHADLQ
jgi:hypothetical protein